MYTLLRVFRPHHNVGIWEVVPEQVTTPFLALIVICTVSLNCNVEYCYVVMIWSLHFQTGATPLYVACQEGHLSVVEQLIAAKAVVNTSRKVGYLGVSVISKVQLRDCSKHSAKVHHQLHLDIYWCPCSTTYYVHFRSKSTTQLALGCGGLNVNLYFVTPPTWCLESTVIPHSHLSQLTLATLPWWWCILTSHSVLKFSSIPTLCKPSLWWKAMDKNYGWCILTVGT